MKITTSEEKGFTIIALSGRIDATNYEQFSRDLIFNSENKKNVVLDCASLEYLNSAGLRSFLSFFKHHSAKGGELKICSLKPIIKEVFDITGFTTLFNIYENKENALA